MDEQKVFEKIEDIRAKTILYWNALDKIIKEENQNQLLNHAMNDLYQKINSLKEEFQKPVQEETKKQPPIAVEKEKDSFLDQLKNQIQKGGK